MGLHVGDRRQKRRTRATITAAHGALEGLSSAEHDEAPGQAEFLHRILGYAALVVEGSDPELIRADALTEAVTEAAAIAEAPSLAIADARSYADDLLLALVSFSGAGSKDFEQVAKDAAATFQRSASQRIVSVNSELEAVESKLIAAREELQTEITSIPESVANLDR